MRQNEYKSMHIFLLHSLQIPAEIINKTLSFLFIKAPSVKGSAIMQLEYIIADAKQ